MTAYLDALNRHDPDAVVACVTHDFVNEHTSGTGTSRYGRTEYRGALDGFLADFGELRYDVESAIVDGDRAAVPYRMSFILHTAGNRPVSVRGVFVFVVVDGLIAHRTDYWDSGEVQRQLS